jgi:hypothetical protein
MSKKYYVETSSNKNIEISDEIAYKIIQDHLSKSYHWSIAIGMFIIGFLLGVVVS